MSKSICIYCGANPGNIDILPKQIKLLCEALARKNYDLVYGGGNSGIMGLVANEFLSHNRSVIGVRPTKLIKDESKHHGITQLIEVESMHDRKAKMIELSDIFIALPGGVGTLDEIIDVYTNIKIGFIDKKCGVLNVENLFDGLDILLGSMQNAGFLKAEDRQKLIIEPSVEALVEALTS